MYLLVDVWANIDGPLLFTCFGGHRKCSIGWAIMPWFQGSGRCICCRFEQRYFFFYGNNELIDSLGIKLMINTVTKGIMWHFSSIRVHSPYFAVLLLQGTNGIKWNRINLILIRLYYRGWFNINVTSYQYRKSHCGDKTILWPSYLHNGVSYTGKMTSLWRIGVQQH